MLTSCRQIDTNLQIFVFHVFMLRGMVNRLYLYKFRYRRTRFTRWTQIASLCLPPVTRRESVHVLNWIPQTDQNKTEMLSPVKYTHFPNNLTCCILVYLKTFSNCLVHIATNGRMIIELWTESGRKEFITYFTVLTRHSSW